MKLRSGNPDARLVDKWLRDLAYDLVSASNGRYRYERDGHPPFVLHVTPSDRRRWLPNQRAKLQQLHPDAPMFQRRKNPKRRGQKRYRNPAVEQGFSTSSLSDDELVAHVHGPRTSSDPESNVSPEHMDKWRCRNCREVFFVRGGSLPDIIDGNGVCPRCWSSYAGVAA